MFIEECSSRACLKTLVECIQLDSACVDACLSDFSIKVAPYRWVFFDRNDILNNLNQYVRPNLRNYQFKEKLFFLVI